MRSIYNCPCGIKSLAPGSECAGLKRSETRRCHSVLVSPLFQYHRTQNTRVKWRDQSINRYARPSRISSLDRILVTPQEREEKKVSECQQFLPTSFFFLPVISRCYFNWKLALLPMSMKGDNFIFVSFTDYIRCLQFFQQVNGKNRKMKMFPNLRWRALSQSLTIEGKVKLRTFLERKCRLWSALFSPFLNVWQFFFS